ncbi:MAG TPA: AI-2E family transporter, partial [Microbacterium sp.]|nr:AI-2E family transporter [Microbacterium sp.]
MSTSDDKPTGSFFDAIRDRRRIVSVQATRGIPPGLHLAAAYAWRFLVIAAAVGVGIWLVI